MGLGRQDREAEGLQIGTELFDGLKAKTSDPGGAGGYQICVAIVDEERFRRGAADNAEARLVDGRFRFDLTEIGGKNVMVEEIDPGEVVFYVGDHFCGHVGKDGGLDSRGVK